MMNPHFICEIVAGLLLQVSIVVFLTVAIDNRLANTKLACHLWTACFLAILGLVAAALLLPHFRLPTVWPGDSRQTMRAIVTLQTGLGRALIFVWITGIGVSLLLRAVWFFQLTKFLNDRCEPINADEIKRRLDFPMRLPSNLRLLISEEVEGPFCWQWHRPTIVLPPYIVAEGGPTMRYVLGHELEHLRTHHPVQLFLQRMCCTVLWFHPAVWWAGRQAELAREYLCDEVAARHGGRISNYLQTLVKIAERGGASPACVLAFGRGRSALAKRTEKLVKLTTMSPQPSTWRQSMSVAGLMLMAIMATQIWLPVNVMASSRSSMSPWPSWSASVLHDFGISVRDFEQFDENIELHDLIVRDD